MRGTGIGFKSSSLLKAERPRASCRNDCGIKALLRPVELERESSKDGLRGHIMAGAVGDFHSYHILLKRTILYTKTQLLPWLYFSPGFSYACIRVIISISIGYSRFCVL